MKAELQDGWACHKTNLPTVDGQIAEFPYYFNTRTGDSQWFRPLTQEHHAAVRQARLTGLAATATPVKSTHSNTVTPPSSRLISPPSLSATSSSSSSAARPPASGHKAMSASASKRSTLDFSLETQQALLQLNSLQLRCVIRIQRWVRRWRLKRQRIIKAKVRSLRATMDVDMMQRLLQGKRRTLDHNAALGQLNHPNPTNGIAAHTNRSTLHNPSLMMSATAPTTPNYPFSRTPVNGSDSPLDPEERRKADKRRQSMLKMLSIQSRFLNGDDLAAQMSDVAISKTAGSSPSAASTASVAAFASTLSTSASLLPMPQSNGCEGDTNDRRSRRLNNRRETLAIEQLPPPSTVTSSVSTSTPSTQPSSSLRASNVFTFNSPAPTAVSASTVTSSSSSSSTSLLSHRPFSTPTLRQWQFVRIVVRLQRLFRRHRIEVRARVSAKLHEQQLTQTKEADRRLRRATMPREDIHSIRKRLSNGGTTEPTDTAQHQ